MKIKIILFILIIWTMSLSSEKGSRGGISNDRGEDIGCRRNYLSYCTPPIITKDSLIGKVATSVNKTIGTTGGDADSIINIDPLPTGLVLDSLTGIITGLPTKRWDRDTILFRAVGCSPDTDTVFVQLDWDTLKIDSCTGRETGDSTVYIGDTCDCRGDFPIARIDPVLDSAFVDDSEAIVIQTTDSIISFIVPIGIDTGCKTISIADTVASDSIVCGINVRGLYDTADIDLDPHDTTVTDGQTVIFHVTATSTGAITYKWQVNDGGGYDDVAASDNDTLTWVAATAENGYLYRCIASDVRGADTSSAATLTVAEVTYTLTVTDDGHGSTDPAGPTVVAQGVGTAIAGTADAHYHTATPAWIVTVGSSAIDDINSASAYCTLSTGNATVRYNTWIDSATVTLGTYANGTITSPCPDQIFAYVETDTVIFTPATGYRVAGATDKLPDTSIFQPAADTTVDTAFELFPTYTATVTISGGGHVDASPGLTVDSGATITLTAVPGADSVFVGWSGDYSGTANPAVITMIRDTATTAIFYRTPVIDSIRQNNPAKLRDSTYTWSGRAADTMKAYGKGFAQGDSVRFLQSSTGNTIFTRISNDATTALLIPSGSSISGSYRSFVRVYKTIDGVVVPINGTLKSRAFRFMTPTE